MLRKYVSRLVHLGGRRYKERRFNPRTRQMIIVINIKIRFSVIRNARDRNASYGLFLVPTGGSTVAPDRRRRLLVVAFE